MNLICLLYTISAFCNGVNLATYSGNLSYDVAEADTFPFPAMLEALYSMSRVPYDFDKTLANDEVTLYMRRGGGLRHSHIDHRCSGSPLFRT